MPIFTEKLISFKNIKIIDCDLRFIIQYNKLFKVGAKEAHQEGVLLAKEYLKDNRNASDSFRFFASATKRFRQTAHAMSLGIKNEVVYLF